jgi:hypothetical protein
MSDILSGEDDILGNLGTASAVDVGAAGEAGKVLAADDPSVQAAGLALKSFGAVWDGVTDDSLALEEAITAAVETGLPILLPPGTGVIDSTPAIPKNLTRPIVIRGAGERDTIVKLKTSLQFLRWAITSKGDTVGNVELYDFTVDGNNLQVSEAGTVPVVIGSNNNSQEQVNIKNFKMRRVRTINVPTLEKQENGRRNVVLQVYHGEPGLAKNIIDNIDIQECDFGGGQYGIFVAGIKGGSPLPLNVYLGRIHISRIKYTGPQVPEAFGYCAGVQVGQYAWSDGKDILIEDIYSENSADVGVELDVPCTARDIKTVNSNNSGLLLNTFNPTTTTDPVVAKLTAKAEVGAVKFSVSSITNFVVGEQIVIYGTDVKTCEVRTIKATAAGEIELTEAISLEHASGSWLSQVDVKTGKMLVKDFSATQTSVTPGNQRGLAIQNVENPLPAPAMEVDGYIYRRTWKGVTTFSGEVLRAQYGTETSKTGNPRALRIRRLQANITNAELAATETVVVAPISLKLWGAVCPIEIHGEVNIDGAGVTGSGKILANLAKIEGNAELDIDLLQRSVLGSTGGEPMRFLCLNEEAKLGSISGRVRQRIRPRLNNLVIEDSDWSGVGTEGTGLAIEDTKVGSRVLTRRTIQPKPVGSTAITVPASTKITQILQGGQSGMLQIKEGTITKVEYSATGSSFFQVASSGNVGIHVNPGDFFKLTYSVAPSAIQFIPDRA